MRQITDLNKALRLLQLAEEDCARLGKELTKLQGVCAEAYQLAGAYDAPAAALDNLSAASCGMPIPHETFLPIHPNNNISLALLRALKAVQQTTTDWQIRDIVDGALKPFGQIADVNVKVLPDDLSNWNAANE